MNVSKVDKVKMEQMLRGGWTNGEVARHFGVTPGRISQLSKDMKHLVVRSASLEKAAEVVDSHLDVLGQLNKINDAINEQLLKAQEAVSETEGRDRLSKQRLIIDLSAEIRRQLDSQMAILELWHDMRVIGEFQQEVLNVLDDVSPGLRDEIIFRLKQKRALRSTVSFD